MFYFEKNGENPVFFWTVSHIGVSCSKTLKILTQWELGAHSEFFKTTFLKDLMNF